MSAILTVLILLVSIGLTQIFILTPIAWLPGLHLPTWFAAGVVALFLFWCMGDE